MSPTEPSVTHPPSRSFGLLAVLSAPLRAGASGASLPPRRLALGLLLTALALLASAAPAFACETPLIKGQLFEPHVFATRAHILVESNVGSDTTLKSKWSAEYAPAAAGGQPPPPASPSWTPAPASATAEEGAPLLFLTEKKGERSETARSLIHHLEPATAYYARFHLENECAEKAERTFEFTTTAVAKPEITDADHDDAEGVGNFTATAFSPTTAAFHARIETNGAPTTYAYEYAPAAAGGVRPAEASPAWHLFTSAATGTVTKAEDFADTEAELAGLTPETTYYVRVSAANSVDSVVQTTYGGGFHKESFTTPTAKPVVHKPEARNVTATSAYLVAGLVPNGSETHWRFESTTEPANPASWLEVPGAAGTVSQAEAEALPAGNFAPGVEGRLTGLQPSHTYYLRLFAENAAGEAVTCETTNNTCEPISTATEGHGIATIQTSGPPSATTLATHALHGESLRLLGSVNPSSTPTSEEQTLTVEGAPTGGSFTLSFEGQTTAPIPYPASAEGDVAAALRKLPSLAQGVQVTGPTGGPYTVYFGGPNGKVDQPQLTADGSALTPSGTITVTTTQPGGEGYDTHYHFDYVSEVQFKEGEWAKAASTAAVDLGTGNAAEGVGADLPPLQAGETYRFRISATNASPGNPVIQGEEHSLTAPLPPESTPAGPCPNQALRTGPSAALPDCRAYEQVTPHDKEGAQEIFSYNPLGTFSGAAVGEDGDHLMLEAQAVNWGAGPTAGQSPYFFSRHEGAGWQLTGAATQPETGFNTTEPHVFDPDLTRLGFQSLNPIGAGPIEYRAGPAGGPYATVASAPRNQAGPGWIAASADFSKLILQTEDHKLLGPSTATKSGADLYEYSAGALRQVNLGLGSCGATIVNGPAELFGESQQKSSRHALSADGSRVFFEAVPGSNCSAPSHLYIREAGETTVDLGPYRFLAADPQGATVLLEKATGENPGLYLYDTQAASASFLPSSEVALGAKLRASEDLRTVYILAAGEKALYRYDLPAQTLHFLFDLAAPPNHYSTTPDGRYFYFASGGVPGLPAGALAPSGGVDNPGVHPLEPTSQVYRYDRAEDVVACISCASPFAPEPKLGSYFGETNHTGGQYEALGGTPRLSVASSNGDYAFFQTPAALLPSDVDGEVIPEGFFHGKTSLYTSTSNSVSGDVYEWRRDGLDGCARLQGCLALITDGRGGYLNLLLGTTPSGRDVFLYTSSRLLTRDNDTAGDIYDARIAGGFPEPAEPIPCEADSCFHPVPAPNDPTPNSENFHGAGNVHEPPVHHKHHRKHHAKKHHKRSHKRAANTNRGGAK